MTTPRLTLRRRACRLIAGPSMSNADYYGRKIKRQLDAQRDRHPSLDGAVNHSPSGIPTLGCVIAWAAAFAVVAVLFGSLLLIYIEPIAEHSRPVSVEIEQRVG